MLPKLTSSIEKFVHTLLVVLLILLLLVFVFYADMHSTWCSFNDFSSHWCLEADHTASQGLRVLFLILGSSSQKFFSICQDDIFNVQLALLILICCCISIWYQTIVLSELVDIWSSFKISFHLFVDIYDYLYQVSQWLNCNRGYYTFTCDYLSSLLKRLCIDEDGICTIRYMFYTQALIRKKTEPRRIHFQNRKENKQ